jgi:hypothetical protein
MAIIAVTRQYGVNSVTSTLPCWRLCWRTTTANGATTKTVFSLQQATGTTLFADGLFAATTMDEIRAQIAGEGLVVPERFAATVAV